MEFDSRNFNVYESYCADFVDFTVSLEVSFAQLGEVNVADPKKKRVFEAKQY